MHGRIGRRQAVLRPAGLHVNVHRTLASARRVDATASRDVGDRVETRRGQTNRHRLTLQAPSMGPGNLFGPLRGLDAFGRVRTYGMVAYIDGR